MTEATQPMQLTIEYPGEPCMPAEPERIAAVCKELAGLAIDFAAIERAPRYTAEKCENNSEHSFMVALVAAELARQFRPDLEVGLVVQYALTHDLIELATKRDVATFNLTEAQYAEKHADEHDKLAAFLPTLPPYLRSLVADYEAQADEAAVFVSMVDKALPPAVDCLGEGRKVMAEDYAIHTPEQLAAAEQRTSERLRRRFTAPNLAVIHLARDILAQDFAVVFDAETAAALTA